ncbi:MAG: ribosomal L7Ae/L30e/S12e/Gadd45 family protein [Peptococcaceae bacterium]|nr:ribosomal L7Ae/L30e/S12e/Gadd45 family protein [Peptococcaceae bacterium]
MVYEQVLSSRKKTVGTKQTLKTLRTVERDGVKAVYIAQDADKRVVEPIFHMCSAKGVPVIEVDSMLLLGRACGIEVGCAAAAVIE